MAMPSGYTELGIVGYADKGTYSASATYNKPDVVYYNGSSYVALKDGMKGVTPSNNGKNWKYLARGFQADTAAQVSATDKRNLIGGGAGKASTVQALLDKIGDWLLDKAITNDNFVSKLTARLVNNGTTTGTGFALDARYGKTLTDKDASLQKEIDTLNRKTPSGYQIKTATYTVPQQDTETNLFAIPTSIVPSNAFAFYAVSANLRHGLIINSCYLGPDRQWRIVTDVKSYGNFYIQMLYLVSE